MTLAKPIYCEQEDVKNFQMFTSPSKTGEDNEGDEQEQVTYMIVPGPYIRLVFLWMKPLRDPDAIPQILHETN